MHLKNHIIAMCTVRMDGCLCVDNFLIVADLVVPSLYVLLVQLWERGALAACAREQLLSMLSGVQLAAASGRLPSVSVAALEQQCVALAQVRHISTCWSEECVDCLVFIAMSSLEHTCVLHRHLFGHIRRSHDP